MKRTVTPHAVMKQLRRLYRERGIVVQRHLNHYGIERFLARLAASPHVDAFVLKGA